MELSSLAVVKNPQVTQKTAQVAFIKNRVLNAISWLAMPRIIPWSCYGIYEPWMIMDDYIVTKNWNMDDYLMTMQLTREYRL